MNIWENTVITAKGIALLSKLVQGNTLAITKAVSGTGYVTPGTLQNQTAVSGIKQTLNFRALSFPEEGKSEVTCYLTNAGLAAGYTAQQVGVYARDPDEGEILFFITQASSGNGTIVPAETESPGFSAEWAFTFPYGQADTVSVTVDPSNTVNHTLMESYVAEAIQPLWPTKEVTGAAIAVKDSANLPFVGLSIYGRSTQDGTPTPDAPVDIVSVGGNGSIEVGVWGKNLLAYPYIETTKTANGVTFTDNGDGSITLNGTATSTTYFKLNDLPNVNGKITAFGCPANGSYSTYALSFDKNGANIAFEYGNGVTVDCDAADTYSLVIAVRKDAKVSNITFYPQAELNNGTDAATSYEKYKAKQTIALSTPDGLPGIPVSSGGNYIDENGQQWICDEIDLERGVYVQRCYTYSAGTISNLGTSANNRASVNLPYSGLPYNIESALCSHFEYKPTVYSDSGNDVGFVVSNKTLFFRFGSSSDINTIALAQEWIDNQASNETPLTVHYILETPIETALSAEEISAYKSLYGYNPNTTILNDAGAGMKVHYVTKTFDPLMKSAESSIAYPMNVGVEYATHERWQGKVVYTKLVDVGTLPSSTTKTVSHGAAATQIIRSYGQASNGLSFPVGTGGNGFYTIALRVGRENIEVYTDTTSYASYTATVQIWYTKD